jgi:hypothetical protein
MKELQEFIKYLGRIQDLEYLFLILPEENKLSETISSLKNQQFCFQFYF